LIEKIPYPEATFDIVISRLVIHHFTDELKRRGLVVGAWLLVAPWIPDFTAIGTKA
jgi:hypothetical protein